AGGRKGAITATSPSVSDRTTGTSSGQSSVGSQSGCAANHQESSLTLGDYAGGAERGRRSADRRDREPGRPKSRDHVLLLAPRRGVRSANGQGANWCTYATWASRQAGRTIRGEDLLEHLG